jgi:branched-subunit amino acid aminotransferase/4-amino-4-deoxychorismate lyase
LILELASALEIPAQETDILPAELLAADEAFISNSMIEIMPVGQVDGRKIGSGGAGELTLKLKGAYSKAVYSPKLF